jgi:hypothetical protein
MKERTTFDLRSPVFAPYNENDAEVPEQEVLSGKGNPRKEMLNISGKT